MANVIKGIIKQIQPNPNKEEVYDISAKAANIASNTGALAYYSDNIGTFANDTNILVLNKTADLEFIYSATTSINGVTSTYTAIAATGREQAGDIKGLLIRGANYGNTASYLASKETGVFSFGDPGPQIQFAIAESNTYGRGALLYTNHNGGGLGGSSFHFLGMSLDLSEGGEKTGPYHEAPVNVVSDTFIAKEGIIVGTNKRSNSATFIVKSKSLYNTGFYDDDGRIALIYKDDNKSTLWLGSSITSNGAIPSSGRLILQSTFEQSKYTILYSSTTAENNYVYLPAMTGTMYLTHVANNSAVGGSTTTPVYVAENGRITAMSAISVDLINTATTASNGLMSSSDKIKINKINDTLTASQAIVTDSNGNIIAKNLTVSSPSASGTATSFITTVSQDSQGKISVAKASLPVATSSINGIGRVIGNSGINVDYDNGVATVKHSNSITANTSYSSSATTLSANGGTLVIRDFKYDNQGHITAVQDREITLSQVDNNTDEKVKQTSSSTSTNYKLLFTTSASPTSGAAAETYYNTNLQYNPGTNILSTGNLNLSGNLSVTGNTTLNNNVTINASLTTNSLIVNGNSSFSNSVSINNGLTLNNGYLTLKPFSSSYNIENSTAVGKIFYIAKNSSYEDTFYTYSNLRVNKMFAANATFNNLPMIGNQTLLQALGLSNALHFIGITSTTMTDGMTAANVTINGATHTPQIGDVVLYDHREYVWTNTSTNGTWEMLGSDASIMSSSGTSNNAANIGIIGISQSSDGTISATTGNLVQGLQTSWTDGTTNGPILSVTVNGVNATATIPTASDTQSGVITTSSQTFKGIKTFYNETTTNDDGYTGILFTIKDSTIPSNKTQSGSSTIRVYSDHRQEGSAGTNFVLQSGGNTIIGSGEAGLTYYNKIAKTINDDSTQNNVIGKWNNTSENFYLLADTSLYLEANNNIPSGETNPINRIGIMIATDGNIIPIAQELNNPGVQSLGSTNAAWKNLYLTNSIVSTTKNLSITLNNSTTKIWIYDNTTTATYNGRNITPSLYVSGTGYFYGAVEASTNFINNVNTTGGGFFIKSQDVEYGRLYVVTQGTTTTTGVARLILGNATATGNIGNAQGSIHLYSSSGTYVNILNSNTTTSVQVKIPNYNDHMVLAHVGNTNNAIGSSTTPVYVEGNGKISAGSTYAGGTKVTLNGTDDRGATTANFYAPTSSGTSGTQALVSSGANTAPVWTNITPSISITNGDGSNAPKINVSVLGQTGTTAKSLNTASTTVYGVVKLSSATNSDDEDLAATPAAVKAAYEANAYAGSIETTSAATYNTEPEVKSVKINGSTTSATTSTTNVQLIFDTSLKVLNFVFS